MPTTIQQVPKEIRLHFGSEGTISFIEELNKKLGMEYSPFFSRILGRLMIKDLSAHDFIQTISKELGMGEKKAKVVAAEIKERVLEQVRRKLFVWGVDISSIETADAESLDRILQEEREVFGVVREKAEEGKAVSVSSPEKKAEEEVSEIKITKDASSEPAKEEKTGTLETKNAEEKEKSKNPFIIFETKKPEGLGEGVKAPPKKLFPSFDFLRPKKDEKGPSKAEIKAPQEEKKTVHYSENRTPLSDSSVFEKEKKDDDVLNLETFEVEKKDQ